MHNIEPLQSAPEPILVPQTNILTDSHPIKTVHEGWFGQMTKFRTLQDQPEASILGRANLIYRNISGLSYLEYFSHP